MTIKEYFELWEDQNNYDFFSFMSDEHQVYVRGQKLRREMREKAGSNPILIEIFDKFIAYDDSLGKETKPLLKDYTLRSIWNEK